MPLFYVLLLLTRIIFITKAPRNFKLFKDYIGLGNPVESATLSVRNMIGGVWTIVLSLRVRDAASSWRLITLKFHMQCVKRELRLVIR